MVLTDLRETTIGNPPVPRTRESASRGRAGSKPECGTVPDDPHGSPGNPSGVYLLEEIVPLRVLFLDQLELPRPTPALDSRFTGLGKENVVM